MTNTTKNIFILLLVSHMWYQKSLFRQKDNGQNSSYFYISMAKTIL